MPTKKQLQDQLDEIKNEIECVKEGLDIAEQEYMIPMLPASAGGVLPTPDGIDEETFSACQGCRTSRFREFHSGLCDVILPKAAENEKIKEIYEWNDEMDTDFIDSVKEREEIFKKYYDCPDIKEKYEELKEENGKHMDLLAERIASNTMTINSLKEVQKIMNELKEENEELRKQIPDKKSKKLSQRDKEVLQNVLDYLSVFLPHKTEWLPEQINLLKRLVK